MDQAIFDRLALFCRLLRGFYTDSSAHLCSLLLCPKAENRNIQPSDAVFDPDRLFGSESPDPDTGYRQHPPFGTGMAVRLLHTACICSGYGIPVCEISFSGAVGSALPVDNLCGRQFTAARLCSYRTADWQLFQCREVAAGFADQWDGLYRFVGSVSRRKRADFEDEKRAQRHGIISCHQNYKNVAYFDVNILVYNGERYCLSEDRDYTVDHLLGEVDRSLFLKLSYYQLVYSVTESENIVALTTRRDGYAFYQKIS